VIYEVEWDDDASRDIMEASAMLSPSEQQTVVSATILIDELLRENPLGIGESRDSSHKRVLFESPVVIEYHVNSRTGLVRVVAAQCTIRKG
jgi:hypothetical protein